MKFYVGSKQTGNFFKNEIRKTFAKNGGFISLAEVRDLFRETPNEDDTKYGWDSDSDLGKKMRVRECKDGWYLYLPDLNAKICFDKDKPLPNIDVSVFPTDDFQKLIDVVDPISASLDGIYAKLDEGFEMICQSLYANGGVFYRPCVVKAKKSGRKEERQDRNAKFHRWADLSKGVQQVVAIVEFDDGHIEQVKPDRVVFKEVKEND